MKQVNKICYSYKKYFITVLMKASINISDGNAVIILDISMYQKINKYARKNINNY